MFGTKKCFPKAVNVLCLLNEVEDVEAFVLLSKLLNKNATLTCCILKSRMWNFSLSNIKKGTGRFRWVKNYSAIVPTFKNFHDKTTFQKLLKVVFTHTLRNPSIRNPLKLSSVTWVLSLYLWHFQLIRFIISSKTFDQMVFLLAFP